jgi:hypothetical protein
MAVIAAMPIPPTLDLLFPPADNLHRAGGPPGSYGAVAIFICGDLKSEGDILTCVYWYLPYPSSTHYVEALMQERRVPVDRATVNRWVIMYAPHLEAFHRSCVASAAHSHSLHRLAGPKRPG